MPSRHANFQDIPGWNELLDPPLSYDESFLPESTLRRLARQSSILSPRGALVPPGSALVSPSGYLLRQRPDSPTHKWSGTPVGADVATRLGRKLDALDLEVLSAVGSHGRMTVEQLWRMLFRSAVTTEKRIRRLCNLRFLAKLEVTPAQLQSWIGRRPSIHNAVVILDWNGAYLLKAREASSLKWNPATVARLDGHLGHAVSVSEAYSYIVAAARATHDYGSPGGTASDSSQAYDWNMTVGWRGNDEVAEHGRQRDETKRRPSAVEKEPLPRPDRVVCLSIKIAKPGEPSENEASQHGQRPNPMDQTPAVMRFIPPHDAAQSLESANSLFVRYVLIEFESGSNSTRDMITKIEQYATLYRERETACRLYGSRFPRIVLITRQEAQVEPLAHTWRTKFPNRAQTCVLLTSLERLSAVSAEGHHALLTTPCWLDAMAPNIPTWLPLPLALGIDRLAAKGET